MSFGSGMVAEDNPRGPMYSVLDDSWFQSRPQVWLGNLRILM